MKNEKKIGLRRFIYLPLGIVLIFFFLFSSCVSKKNLKLTVIERHERFFWQITGLDSTGKQSTVYILGTIPFGDGTISSPVEKSVLDIFMNVDRYASEISAQDISKLEESVQNLMKPALQGDIREKLSAEEKTILFQNVASNTVNTFATYEPWVFISLINNALYEKKGLSTKYSMDYALLKKALETKKEIIGFDSLKTQLDLLTIGTYDEQLAIFKDKINLFKNSERLNFYTDLYNAYIKNDKQTFAKTVSKMIKTENELNSAYGQYNKKLFEARNKKWAREIAALIHKGGETFVFADARYFLGDYSVLNAVF